MSLQRSNNTHVRRQGRTPGQVTAQLQSIGEWAKNLPAFMWKPGAPDPSVSNHRSMAVITERGRILTGRPRTFSARCLQRLEGDPRYGFVLGYVEARDEEIHS